MVCGFLFHLWQLYLVISLSNLQKGLLKFDFLSCDVRPIAFRRAKKLESTMIRFRLLSAALVTYSVTILVTYLALETCLMQDAVLFLVHASCRSLFYSAEPSWAHVGEWPLVTLMGVVGPRNISIHTYHDRGLHARALRLHSTPPRSHRLLLLKHSTVKFNSIQLESMKFNSIRCKRSPGQPTSIQIQFENIRFNPNLKQTKSSNLQPKTQATTCKVQR